MTWCFASESIRLDRRVAPGRRPRLSVTAEQVVFDRWRFAVADNGIGLALCRRIVHRFSRTIRVTSTPGSGTTFFFTLQDGGSAPP